MIPPNSVEDFECLVVAGKQPGAFGGQIHVYVDDVGLRELILILEGEVVEVPAKGLAPPALE